MFGALTLYILASAAVIRMRRAEPELARPHRAPLYPITPIVALVCVVAMAWTHPYLALLYAGLLGGSWALFALLVPAERRIRF